MKSDVLTHIDSTYGSVATLNANFDKIATAFANTVSRDGSAPNAMGAALDMNHYKIQNLADAVTNTDAMTLGQYYDLTVAPGAGASIGQIVTLNQQSIEAAASAVTASLTASSAATTATTAATNAGLYASAAQAFSVGMYVDTASGITATTSTTNKYFLVVGSGNTFADLYKNVSGLATSQSLAIPSLASVAQLTSSTSTLGRTLSTGGISGATGGVWVDYQPTASIYSVVGASAYIDTVGSGVGSFIWFSPNGSQWKVEKIIPATSISTIGIYTQAVTPFVLPAGSIMGFYSPDGGAQVDVKVSGGAGRNLVPMTPAEGASYNLISEAFIIAVSMDVHTLALGDRVTSLENKSYVTDQETLDRVMSASASAAGLVVTASGTINRNGNTRPFTGNATAATPTSTNVRYDVMYLDLVSMGVGIVSGTERATGKDAAEFIPSLGSPTRRALFNLRVQSGAVSIVSVWDFDDNEHRAIAKSIERDRTIGRRVLRKTRNKIARLAALRIAGLGDSITAIQSGTPSKSTPNGAVRDQGQILNNYLNNGILGSDVIAAQTLYTAVQLGHADDGAGATHTKFGFNWNLVRDLEGVGYTLGTGGLIYDNWGYAGEASDGLVSGGSPSAWTNALIATAPDLAIVAMGMNEYNSANTEANMVTALTAIRNAGIECIVLGVARKNSSQSITGWEFTNRALKRAADYTGCAFVDMRALYDDQYLGAIGMTTDDICGCNHINHPGIREHLIIGKYLTRMLMN